MKYFIVILLIIFFIPFPIKITFFISNKNLVFKVYNFDILKIIKKKKTHKPKNTKEKAAIKKEDIIHNKKQKKFSNLSLNNILKVISLIKNNKLKPSLKIKGSFEYSLNDSAKTAISYGIISSYLPMLIGFFKIFFKVKKFQMPIKPLFKEKFFLKLEINSIITFSLVQIIYMIILVFKGLKILKGGEKLERVEL